MLTMKKRPQTTEDFYLSWLTMTYITQTGFRNKEIKLLSGLLMRAVLNVTLL